MVWKSTFADADITDVSLPSVVLARAASLKDKPALIDGASGRSLSYWQLAEGVKRVARGLADKGLKRGDVLGLYSPNLPEYAMAVQAVASLGATVTTVTVLCESRANPAFVGSAVGLSPSSMTRNAAA